MSVCALLNMLNFTLVFFCVEWRNWEGNSNWHRSRLDDEDDGRVTWIHDKICQIDENHKFKLKLGTLRSSSLDKNLINDFSSN